MVIAGIATVFLGIALGWSVSEEVAADEEKYDVVIANGRVMDPETGLDAVRNVGINGGKIRAISANPLTGKTTMDAKGLVVAPGFIDMHEHGQEPSNYQFQAHDGVTTSLELEVGTADVAGWYAAAGREVADQFRREHRTYSGAHEGDARSGRHFCQLGAAAHRAATPEELDQISAEMEKGFREGALAEGMGVNYTAAASHEEIVEMFKIAAKLRRICACAFAIRRD